MLVQVRKEKKKQKVQSFENEVIFIVGLKQYPFRFPALQPDYLEKIKKLKPQYNKNSKSKLSIQKTREKSLVIGQISDDSSDNDEEEDSLTSSEDSSEVTVESSHQSSSDSSSSNSNQQSPVEIQMKSLRSNKIITPRQKHFSSNIPGKFLQMDQRLKDKLKRKQQQRYKHGRKRSRSRYKEIQKQDPYNLKRHQRNRMKYYWLEKNRKFKLHKLPKQRYR